jgi:peptidoglycan/LPS O-acetylase OafA/YrhL
MTISTVTANVDQRMIGKGHYVILDGLRGVASVLVVVFHLFEAYACGSAQKQIINHGYLAVDFFFVLSGFVVAYAYDDRWGQLTQWDFYKRRLIRLQPMIIMGTLIGVLLFYFGAGPTFPKIASATSMQVFGIALLGLVMIPLPKAFDIRGWDETYPLNGPAWSLMYEYIANILYALGLRKLSNRALAVVVALAGAAMVQLTVFGSRGDLIGGWSFDADGIRLGMTRVMYPFFAGVLLMRLGWRVRIGGAFGVCSLLLLVALGLPRFGGTAHLWLNGLYEALCVILLFPLIVAIGAGDKQVDGPTLRIARFFGEMSYPLYITHYPLMYLYTAWVVERHIAPMQGAIVGAGVLIVSVILAYISLKAYDEPLRRWLGKIAA